MNRQFIMRNEPAQGYADQLVRLVAEDALHGRIDGGETALQVERGDDVVGGINQRSVAFLAVGKRLLGNFSLGDIEHKAQSALGFAGPRLAAKRHPTLDKDPTHRAIPADDAVLVLEGAAAGGSKAFPSQGFKAGAILWVDALGDFARRLRIGGEPENGLQLR